MDAITIDNVRQALVPVPDELRGDMEFDEQGYDSLSRISAFAKLERELDIKIPDIEFEGLTVPDRLVTRVNELLRARLG
ncbi:acyl carrier protein [Actinophytocola oryzae]|uniref:Phosphopantetheine binding protein n=1 Tax=Actinophytocola oryzae TaxID=502181 RepID=A0A4R7UST1_9PSEU|nr:acyl carrier protein [Actinophytocola oryzae]TDV38605.1 phosphopantetheine binding protein [Actinophytocola oryzae]